MKTQAIRKLLDLAKRLPSIEILDTAEVTPLLEAVRAIKAAEGELEAACDGELEEAQFAYYLKGETGETPLSEQNQTPEPTGRTLSLSF